MNLYYEPHKDEQFNELKEKAIVIWKEYDNTYGYVDEKINCIKNINNISDNFMYIVAMFDLNNQFKLASKLTDKTRKSVRDRIIAGGQPVEYIVF